MTINKEQAVSDAMIDKLWTRRHDLTNEEWLEAGPVLLGLAVAMKSKDEAASHPLEQQQAVSGDVVERVARAIYDAPDTQSGDTVGTVIWNSEHLFYETLDGEEIADTARRVSMGVCRDAAIAALTASGVERMRTALEAVEGAMLRGGDGAIGDFGWNITKLNKARPLIRTALQGGE